MVLLLGEIAAMFDKNSQKKSPSFNFMQNMIQIGPRCSSVFRQPQRSKPGAKSLGRARVENPGKGCFDRNTRDLIEKRLLCLQILVGVFCPLVVWLFTSIDTTAVHVLRCSHHLHDFTHLRSRALVH